MGKVWEICSHSVSIVWVSFSIRFPSCGMLHHMGNTCVFSSISYSMGKDSKTHLNEENLRNWFLYSFHSLGVFSVRLPSCGILHHMGNAWAFSWISHMMEKAVKPIEWGKPGKFFPILLP